MARRRVPAKRAGSDNKHPLLERMYWVFGGIVVGAVALVTLVLQLLSQGDRSSPPTTSPPAPVTSGTTASVLGRVRITDVRASDGKSGFGGELTVDVAVEAPPAANRKLFLIANLHQHGTTVPRALYVAKSTLVNESGFFPLSVRLGYSGPQAIGLARTFLVVSADGAATAELEENLEHQLDPKWDSKRLTLPDGATEIARWPKVIVRTRP